MRNTKLLTTLRNSLLATMSFVMVVLYPAPAVANAETGTPAASDPAATSIAEPATNPAPAAPLSEPASAPPADPAPATAPTPAPQQEAPKPATGPTTPTGADAVKYTYNPSTGKWESDKYIWDPATGQTQPKQPPSYSYNPQTGMWDTKQWRYNPATGKYEANIVSVPQVPAGAKIVGSLDDVTPTTNSANNFGGNNELTGPGSNNNTTQSINNNGFFDLYHNASISNNITNAAQSGNATSEGNTVVGNTLTGSATAMLTLLNLLQSAWGPLGSGVTTFMTDIFGNVIGDLFIDPSQLSGSTANQTSVNNNLTVNADNKGRIDNTINLDATSGNASATSNTQAGDVGSGNATAMANIVNMINSMIGAGQSFLGTVNIHGNLEGDILLPQDVLNSLIASSGPSATIDNSTIVNNEVIANLAANQTINNTINANAASGNASATANTTAGNVTTGNASSQLTVLNLTGREVIGENALLVFINVMGNWVGAILNAPAGTTAAALGGNVSNNTTINNSTEINAADNQTINNTINVNAQSGDATAANNTLVGDVRSGDASARVNLLNVTNSSFNLSDWFGILFINVFGNWNGNFGIDTIAGNRPAVQTTVQAESDSNVRVFQFVPAGNGKKKLVPATGNQAAHAISEAVQAAVDDAEASRGISQPAEQNDGSQAAQNGRGGFDPVMPLFGFAIGSTLLGIERFQTLRERRRK